VAASGRVNPTPGTCRFRALWRASLNSESARRPVRRLNVGLERRQPQGLPIVALVGRAKMQAVVALVLGFQLVLLG